MLGGRRANANQLVQTSGAELLGGGQLVLPLRGVLLLPLLPPPPLPPRLAAAQGRCCPDWLLRSAPVRSDPAMLAAGT